MELLQADQAVKRPADKCKASFGRTVTLRRHDGREQSFKILSEDEADPSRGTVSPYRVDTPSSGHGAVILDVRQESVQVSANYGLVRNDQRESDSNVHVEARPRSDRARQGLWSGGSRTPHARHLKT